MKDLDWEDIRHFHALAAGENVAAAATALKTSQVTVMRRVKALEQALGATLFLRRRDGHRLTAAGLEFQKSAQEAAEVIRDAANRVTARDAKPEGRVRIVTTELAANWILLPAIANFMQKNPLMNLEIDASPAALGLTDNAETLAVRFQRPDSGPYRVKKLGEIEFGLYRRGTPRNSLSSAGLSGDFVGWAGDFEGISLARWLKRIHGGATPAVALTTFEGHLKAAISGLGAAGLPVFVGSAEPRLQRVEPLSEPLKLTAWLVIPLQIANSARIRIATQFVTSAFGSVGVPNVNRRNNIG